MNFVERVQLGPQAVPLTIGRSVHGRWRCAYQPAAGPHDDHAPAALHLVQDADRLVFALADGPAAALLAYHLAEHLWTMEDVAAHWPEPLWDWLSETSRWTDLPPGRTTFIAGRVERLVPGGLIYLAWLGMNGVRLLTRMRDPLALDTRLKPDDGWSPQHGPGPDRTALHAHRGTLFQLERLVIASPGAMPLVDDLADLSSGDLQQALEDWGREAARDLAVLDLRFNPVQNPPSSVLLTYHWVAPEQCILTWRPGSPATGYRLEEASSTAFDDASLLAELNDERQTSYRFSPPASRTHYYRVIPHNQGVPGEPSEPVSVVPLALAAPIMEPVEWSSDGGYHLRWTPIPQATGYEVQASASAGFEPDETQMIYRGDLAETVLPYETRRSLFYRVRAINVLYAPHTPSAWSHPRRSPARLSTPVWTEVSQRRVAWKPVPGARQYIVQVRAKGFDVLDQGEMVSTVNCFSAVAEQPTIYRVRALRRPDDERTSSEWSEAVTVAPPTASLPVRVPNLKLLASLLIVATLVALLVGVALGIIGLQAFQRDEATPTPAVAATPEALDAASWHPHAGE
ncbi:MAG: fibronectin type III domain-containing protein [Chloroflexi bacterium]|nr:fibronectin type III domain-containing protein [Chloroflexota bacterium]